MKFSTAVILCGGKGTRLGSLGEKIPKTLVNVEGYPILWYIIFSLIRNSINHLILPLGYKGEMIKKFIKKKFQKNNQLFKIDLIDNVKNTSIAKRINKVKKFIKSKNFVLLNGDAIFDFDLNKIFLNHEKKNTIATFLCGYAPLDYGVISKEKNKIINFTREINFNTVLSSDNKKILSFVYSGMVILNKITIKSNFKHYENFEKKLYPKLIKKHQTNLINIKGFWHSIDSIKDLERLSKKKNFKKFKDLLKIRKKNEEYEQKFLEK